MKKSISISLATILVIALSGLILVQVEEERAMTALGLKEGVLQPCPNRQNCHNSDDPQEKFQIPAIADPEGKKWSRLVEVMAQLPRTELIVDEGNYRHFTQTSARMRFVDDIEFHFRPQQGEIAVRSASRLGYRDFGVNMQRIEHVRALLKE